MLDIYDYPNAIKLWRECDFYFEELLREAQTSLGQGKFIAWPKKINLTGLWEVCGVKFKGEQIPNAGLPVLSKLLRSFDNAMFENAGYSVLAPGTEITPHRGYTDQVLRFHYGLKVPDGECGIQIDGVHYQWAPRRPLLFDDTLEHSAWNRTKGHRLILLLDLRRDCL